MRTRQCLAVWSVTIIVASVGRASAATDESGEFLPVRKTPETNDQTNTLALMYSRFETYHLEELPATNTFWLDALDRSGRDGTLMNHFGPLTDMDWIRQNQWHRFDIYEYENTVGRDALIGTFENGFREAFVSRISYEAAEEWILGDSFLGRFVNGLVEGSVGNTREEQQNFTSVSPNAVTVQDSFMRGLKDNLGLKLGAKPWYGFMRADVGKNEGQPIMHADLRLGLAMNSLDFGVTNLTRMVKFEGNLVFPLPADSEFSVGGQVYPVGYIDPQGFDAVNYSPRITVRFNHFIGKQREPEYSSAYSSGRDYKMSGNGLYGILSIGFSAGPHETIEAGQLTIPLDALNRLIKKL